MAKSFYLKVLLKLHGQRPADLSDELPLLSDRL